MAVTGHLYKLAFGGPLFTLESWSCNIHMLATSPMTETGADFEDALTAWHVGAGANHSASAKLAFIKFNEIDPVTGKYLDEANADSHFLATPPVGVGGAQDAQVSICSSWVTAVTRGYANKGRIYPPSGLTNVNTSTGQITPTQALNQAQATLSLITVINGFGEAKAVVFSKTGQVTRQITGVRVGLIPDTQRRRRSQLVEDYQVQMA